MFKIDFIAHSLSDISRCLIDMLNELPIEDDWQNAVCDFMDDNKDLFHIQGYFLSGHDCGCFSLELHFIDFHALVRLEFKNKGGENEPKFHTSLKDLCIITTKPIMHMVDGIICCEYKNDNINKEEWVRNAIEKLIIAYRFSNDFQGLVKSIVLFKREFNISNRLVQDVCIENCTMQEYETLCFKYGAFNDDYVSYRTVKV